MNRRKIFSLILAGSLLIQYILPLSVIAQGGGIVVTKITSFSAPSSVTKDVPFAMSASIKNATDSLPDPSYHIPMRFDSCTLATQTGANPNQNTHNIQLVSFNPITYNGTTTPMDIQQGSLGGVPTVMPRNEVVLESGDSISLSFTGEASLDVAPGDTLYTTLTCTFYATGPNPIGGDNFGDAPSSNRLTVLVASSTTPTPADPIPTPDNQPLLGVKLPSIFTATGSETTNIAELTEDELKSLDNFKLDVRERGSITFTDPIDFTDGEIITKLHVLDDYVEIGKGFVEIQSDNLPQFDVAATVELEDLNLVDGKIEILMDGKSAGNSATNFRYSSSTKVLLFDVDGFSKYEVGTGLEVSHKREGDNVVVTGSVSDLDSTVSYSVDGRESATDIDFDDDGEFELEFTSDEAKESIVVTAVGSTGVAKTEEIDLTEGTLVDDVVIEEGNNLLLALGLVLAMAAMCGVGYYVVRKRKAKRLASGGFSTVSEVTSTVKSEQGPTNQ